MQHRPWFVLPLLTLAFGPCDDEDSPPTPATGGAGTQAGGSGTQAGGAGTVGGEGDDAGSGGSDTGGSPSGATGGSPSGATGGTLAAGESSGGSGGTLEPPEGTGLRITVKRDGFHNAALSVPAPNVFVLFQDASGAIIGQTLTDANGEAWALTASKYVTVWGGVYSIFTYTDVEEGDELLIDDDSSNPEAQPPLPDLGAYEVRIPREMGGEPGDYSVTLGDGCGADGSGSEDPYLVTVAPSCYVAGGLNAAGLVSRFDGDVINGFAFNTELPVARPGETLEVGLGVNLDEPGSATIDVSSSVPDAGHGKVELYSFVNGREFLHGGDGDGFQGGVYFAYPTGFSIDVGIRADVTLGDELSNHRVAFRRYTRDAAPGPDWSHTVQSADFLPPLESATLVQEEGRPVLKWTFVDGPNAGGDAILAKISRVPGATESVWTIIAKPTRAGSIALPDLPSHLAPHPELLVQDSLNAFVLVDRGLGHKAFKKRAVDVKLYHATRDIAPESLVRLAHLGGLP
jgi:hypothetical protein